MFLEVLKPFGSAARVRNSRSLHPTASFPGLLLWAMLVASIVGCRESESTAESTEQADAGSQTAQGNQDAEPDDSTTPANASSADDDDHSAAPVANASALRPKQEMPWESWDQPELAVLLTGEQHGFFEPCGCTADQLGGMSRRADLVRRLKEAGWNITGVDLGGLPRRSGRQAVLKAQTSLKALTALEYLGAGLGPDELKLGIDGLLDIHLQEGEDKTVRFISANVRLLDGAIEELPVVSVTKEINGVKVGVTSVISQLKSRQVFPMGDAEYSPAEPALESVLSQFAAEEVDLRILLSHGGVEDSMALAKKFPQFQIVVTADGLGDPDPNAAPKQVGETLIIEAGRKGKHVGVLGVYTTDDGPKLKYKLVSLERDDFGETNSMIRLMEIYQNRLREERIVESEGIGNPHPTGASFVGADKCGECHTTAFDIWKNTGHAHAFEDLDPTFKRHGFGRLNGVNRTFDPECLSCHVTGWDPQEYIRYESGFLNEEFASTDVEKNLQKLLGGSQCENCHGPGSRHIEMVEAGEDNAGASVILKYEDAKNRCIKCHDGDNSPNFEFEKYWKRVEHKGLD